MAIGPHSLFLMRRRAGGKPVRPVAFLSLACDLILLSAGPMVAAQHSAR
jgi:arginine exporter protein ArgO